MAFNYVGTAATATRLLQRFGAAATLKRQTAGAYNPAAGTSTPSVAELATIGCVLPFSQKYIDGTLILQGDQRVLLGPQQFPKQGDTVNVRSPLTGEYGDYIVVSFLAHGGAGTPVLFEVQVRG